MRLQQYINESKMESMATDIDEIIEIVKRECKQYLKMMKGKLPLTRGVYVNIRSGGTAKLYRKDVRQDRASLGGIPYNDEMNKWLVKNGHLDRRKSISVTSNVGNAKDFGQPFVIFPLGKFSYSFVDERDFNDLWFLLYKSPFRDSPEIYRNQLDSLYKEQLGPHITTNKQFDVAYIKHFEIWMNPKQYYMISTFDDDVNIILKELGLKPVRN
jgi:hypothetical protein